MPPLCRLLDLQQTKLKKPEPADGVKDEVKTPGPSPPKKLTTEWERKMKAMPGDLSLMKARYVQKM